jgi:hypothetical protein
MKKVIIGILVLITLNVNAQKVTDTLLIKMDTTTYKYVLSLIQENIDSRTATGKTILGNIINPLQKFTFLQPSDKPKELAKPKQ